jgi:acyl-coenzyme A synthetase/AMP-(fatty) acid ligase
MCSLCRAGSTSPKSVEFTAAFPRTTTGKAFKRELRAQLAGRE